MRAGSDTPVQPARRLRAGSDTPVQPARRLRAGADTPAQPSRSTRRGSDPPVHPRCGERHGVDAPKRALRRMRMPRRSDDSCTVRSDFTRRCSRSRGWIRCSSTWKKRRCVRARGWGWERGAPTRSLQASVVRAAPRWSPAAPSNALACLVVAAPLSHPRPRARRNAPTSSRAHSPPDPEAGTPAQRG